jgi:hypothetical protein
MEHQATAASPAVQESLGTQAIQEFLVIQESRVTAHTQVPLGHPEDPATRDQEFRVTLVTAAFLELLETREFQVTPAFQVTLELQERQENQVHLGTAERLVVRVIPAQAFLATVAQESRDIQELRATLARVSLDIQAREASRVTQVQTPT